MHTLHKKRGFSLIELIVTLLIGSILLAWGVPNFRDFKIRREVIDNTNEFVYSVNLARAEAIRYGREVQIRPQGGGWNQGWQIFLINPATANELLANVDALSGGLDFAPEGSFSGNIAFNRLGALAGGAPVRLKMSKSSVSNAERTIEITATGIPRVIKP